MLAVSVGSVGAMATASSAAPADAGLECFGATATIVGTPGDDVIRGTNGPDVIVGERGDDRINGRGGDDLICGRSGDDKILGGKGDDRVRGWRGDDLIVGGPGNDRLLGGLQADRMLGGAGDDVLDGGEADDICDGGTGVNHLVRCEVTPNQAPTDLALAPTAVTENQPAGTVVGTLSAVDPDAGDTHAFTLVDGTGSADNGSFSISGTSLKTAASFDHEGMPSLSVRVRATDSGGLSVEKAFTVTVTDVDDPPVAVDDTRSLTEDASATAVDVLANDTDVDGGPKTVEAVNQPTHGAVTITGGGSGLTYAPDANYCNDGTPTDDFTYTLNGGDVGSVKVTVTCVDDVPVAVDDAATVAEDDAATAIDVLANDTDVDAGPKAIGSVTQPANGTVVITGGGTGLTYTPTANYCNDGPPTDGFTYTLTPGGSVGHVAATVTCIDDPPVAVNDATTVAEDSGATAVDVRANDTDSDGGPKSVQSVTQPANGAVVITGGGTGLTYEPNANYCNSPPGTTPDTFTYTLNGGSTATVSALVACVDDAPVAVNDTATVAEDDAATAIDVMANDTDVDGGQKSVQSVTQPGHGSVVIIRAGTGVSYTPDADFCGGPDTFTYTLNGGITATVSVTVTCAPDAPVLHAGGGGPLLYTENDPATPLAPALTLIDVDAGGTITGATVRVSSNYAGVQDVLSLGGLHPGITASQTGDTLTLAGTASPAAYQAALRDVTYRDSSDSPSTLTRTLTFTATDDTALSDSDTRNIQFTGVDDSPVAVNDSTTVGEDSGVTLLFVLTNDTDVDGGPIAVSSVTQPANGTVSNNGTDVSYTPNANYCNNPPGGSPDTFTYTLAPGGSTATVWVTVNCQPDAPDVTTSGGHLGYTENDPATPIDAGLTVTDPDAGATITGVTVAITANFAGAQDVLALAGVHPGISAGPQVGNTLTLTGTATPAAYQAALRDVTYVNTSEGPSTLARTVTFTVTDDTALSDSATRGITVAAVNDPPHAVDDSGATDEDTPLSVAAPGVLANDTDVDPGDTKTVTKLNGTATLTQTLPSGASVTINANGSYSYNPLAAFQGLSTGQTASDSFTYAMQDGAGAQDTATVNITVSGISDAPTAVADSFDAIGNTGLFVGTSRPATQAGKQITGSVLANDTDPDTPQANLVVEPVTNAPTALGGTITIGADGSFTYQPDDGDVGVTDTFTYRVCDASPCSSGTVANSTGTLSLPIAGQVWYVRNNEPAGGDGTSDTPFDTLAEAEAASGTGDTTYVFDGNNTTTNLDTGYAMNAGERLIGESSPLSLDPDGGGPLPTSALFPGTSGAQPTLTASNEDVIVLASNVLVDGVDVDPSGTGGGISGGAGVDAVTVQNVNVTDTGTAGTQPGIEMDGTTGVNRFAGVTVTNGGSSTAIGVRINNADRVLFANTATNTIATTGAKALDVASTSLLTSRWNDITVTGSGTGAIRLNSVTGQPVLGDGSGTDLSLQTTSGATAALDIASSNTVTVDSAGTDTISATGGPALDIRNSNGSQFFLDSANSTNSAGDGINLDTNLTAPVVINAGTIAGAAGIAFDVNGGGVGGGGVVYDGAINDGPGQSVEVTGRDGGGITFSGNIADSADAGGGIVISGNSAGSTTFSGASKVLNTGAGNAVALSSNGNPANGHLVSFTNGGLDIDATSGQGLSASAGGQLQVTGTGNTIDTGTGAGLVVNGTGIAASNLTFQHISSNGAANGILLNSTGSSGGLTVTGNAGTCSSAATCTGGVILNTVSAVSLTNTQNVSIDRMFIQNTVGDGIDGTTTTNFSFTNGRIDNSGTGLGAETSNIGFNTTAAGTENNLSGTVTITGNTLTSAYYHGIDIFDFNGAIASATITGNTITSTTSTTTSKGSGIRLVAFGSAGTVANVTKALVDNNAISNFPSANGILASGGNGNAAGSPGTFGTVGSGTNVIAITNNTLVGNPKFGAFGIGVTDNGKGQGNVNVSGNSVTNTIGTAISVGSFGFANLSATVNNNTVVAHNNVGAQGIGAGTSQTFGATDTPTLTITATGNNVSQTDGNGILVTARDATGQVNATIKNNTVAAPLSGNRNGIRVDSGNGVSVNDSVCLDIASNTSAGSGLSPEAIGLRKQGAVTAVNGFGIEGMAATATPGVEAYVSGKQNAGSQSTLLISATSGFSSCNTAP